MRERNGGTLHHRFTRHGEEEDEPTAPLSASKRKRPHTRIAQRRRSGWFRPSLRILGIAVLSLYLVVYYRVLLTTEHKADSHLAAPSERQMLARHILDKQEWSEIRDVSMQIQRDRVLPTPGTRVLSITWHASYHGTQRREAPEKLPLASIESICGFLAQNASLHGENYYQRDTLTAASRVLITNILHPVAFSLAAQITMECNSHVIAAFDRVRNPRASQEMLSLLVSREIVPDARHVMPAYVGLDTTGKSRPPLLWTGQSDILQYKPTHIVHFGIDEPSTVNLVQMEQILQSLSVSEVRPHFVYTVSARDDNQSHILADAYFESHQIEATGLRLPETIFGPRCNSTVDRALREQRQDISDPMGESRVAPVYVRDVVEGLVAAMQYRPTSRAPTVLSLPAGDSVPLTELIFSVGAVLQGVNSSLDIADASESAGSAPLSWSPRTSLREGLLRSFAWNIGEQASSSMKGVFLNETVGYVSGDELLVSHGIDPCQKLDAPCQFGHVVTPCSAECAESTRCQSSVLDNLVNLTRDVTEGCDVVLYTQSFNDFARDLTMQAEYEDEGSPMICNFAFVSSLSPLVESSIKQVPNEELVRLGAVPQPNDAGDPSVLHARIREKLNGRLLYRGWILIWPDGSLDDLTQPERFLLKLSPGRFFHHDVKHALFVSQVFPVTPSLDDIRFLVETMNRTALPARGKRKLDLDPPVKIRVPPEPPRRAGVLMSALRFEDSPDYRALSPDTEISIKEASMFMRYEKGDHELAGEPVEIHRQRDYYERFILHMNKATWIKAQSGPSYHFRMRHWASTRWVLHDLWAEDARQFRCAWYKEHAKWGTSLDQMSFAFLMAKNELDRRVLYDEPDDFDLDRMEDLLAYRRLVSDANEWHPLGDFSLPEHEFDIKIYPVDLEMFHVLKYAPSYPADESQHVFAHIISDRAMASERRAWTKAH